MADDQLWYQLDGSWHKSVASKLSALHLASTDPQTKSSAACSPMTTALFMSDGYSKADAAASGRTLCKRCLKIQERHGGDSPSS